MARPLLPISVHGVVTELSDSMQPSPDAMSPGGSSMYVCQQHSREAGRHMVFPSNRVNGLCLKVGGHSVPASPTSHF